MADKVPWTCGNKVRRTQEDSLNECPPATWFIIHAICFHLSGAASREAGQLFPMTVISRSDRRPDYHSSSSSLSSSPSSSSSIRYAFIGRYHLRWRHRILHCHVFYLLWPESNRTAIIIPDRRFMHLGYHNLARSSRDLARRHFSMSTPSHGRKGNQIEERRRRLSDVRAT